MLLNDSYAMVPGLTTSRETYESEFRWGSQYQGVFANGLIDGNSVDTGNTGNTATLRAGLLLGQVISTGKYKQYSPTATDGSEVACAVLLEGLRMTDYTGTAVDRFYAVLVGGPLQASKLIGLDLQARQQMSNRFIFDDIFQLPGNHWFPYKRVQTKTAAYTIVGNDNFSRFVNRGAAGAVALTLPAIANGYCFELYCEVAQTFSFTSNEGSNIVGNGNASGSTISVATIGGGIRVVSNPAGDKWHATNISAGSNAISIS